MLDQTEPSLRKSTLRPIWGGKLSPELTQRIVDLAEPSRPGSDDALYFSLSTMRQKPPAAVERLIEHLSSEPGNSQQRAMWGLQNGIPQESKARVSEAALELISTRSGQTRTKALELLKLHAQPEQLPSIQNLADQEGFTQPQQEILESLINRLSS